MPKRPSPATLDGRGLPRPRAKASREIIESLRHGIASGVLKRGERLPNEADLAAHFGVSQPTVREALRVLEVMGLIDVRHGSGVYVTGDPHQFMATAMHTLLEMDQVGILDVVDMRVALAGYSVSRAVTLATDEDLDVVAEQNRRLEEAAESADFHLISEAAIAFQVGLAAASHNPLLFAIESFLGELLVRLQIDAFSKRDKSFWREWSLQFADDRQQLVAALRERDQEKAVAAVTQYLDRQRRRFSTDERLARARISSPEVLEVIRPLIG